MVPFESISGDPQSRLLLICDHASNAVPPEYANLGLPAAQFERHIAWDIGAADATRRLAAHFNAPAVLGGFSRLLIDANRGDDDPTLVMRLSDGAIIPGNVAVDEAEVERRRVRFWRPYRQAVTSALERLLAMGQTPVIVSIHSFTPVWRSVERPWQMAVLWDGDARIAAPLITALRAAGVVVGDNEPYDGALEGDTLHENGTARGIPHVLVEFRQDLVADLAGVAAWADRLAMALTPVLALQETHMITHQASRTRRDQGNPI